MPQMMPINWIFSFIYFTLIFMFFCILNYYLFNNNNNNDNTKIKLSIQNKNLHWKW